MKAKYTIAVIVFVAAIAAFVGLTATNTFAFPGIPILQQEQAKQSPQSIQTETENEQNDSNVEVETETNDDSNEQLEAETETNDDSEDQDEVDPQQASQAQITADEAKEIAVKHVDAQLSDVTEVELEDHNGNLVYSVEIAKPGKLFEVEVDAINGTVMILEQDEETGTEANDDAEDEDQVSPEQASKAIISQQEAKEIAVKHVGAQLSDIKAVELESEGGKTIYSVEIVIDYKLIEVEIDATNGNVIGVEHGDD